MPSIATLHNNTSQYLIAKDRDQAGTVESRAAETLPEGTVLGRRASDGVWLRFLPGETDGTEIPAAVLMEEFEAGGAAETLPTHVLIEGEVRGLQTDLSDPSVSVQFSGRFDGDDLQPLTDAQADLLRSYGVLTTNTRQALNQDNDAPPAP